MSVLTLIPVSDIIVRNYNFTGIKCDPARREMVERCYCSIFYYATLEEQITSIVESIIKGHFFVDGNKRTALYVYLMLSKINKVQCIEEINEQIKAMEKLAEAEHSIPASRNILFPAGL